MAKNLYYNKKTKKFQSTPTTNQYGLTKVDNEEISRNSQKRKAENAAKESQWAKARQAREAEKQTESYKRQQAANERHKKNIQLEVRQGTDKFNNQQKKIASLNPTTSARSGREAQARARARREKTNPQAIPMVKPSTRYENTTSTQIRPKNSNRDTRYDNDMANFYEYRYNKADMTDYDPKTGNSTEHWRNLKEQIKRKNNWTDKQFDSYWNAYDKERTQAMADQDVAQSIDIAKKHPVLGTLLQGAYTPQSMIEGATSAITALLPDKYKAKSADDPMFTGTRAKEAIKQTVKDEHINSNIGKGAYDLATGLGDMVLSMGVPVLGTGALGASTAARGNMQALERGIDPTKAAQTGLAQGLASGIMNKVGFDWAMGGEAAGETAKEVLKTIGKAALKEGAENVTEDTANLITDKLINKNKSQLNSLHDYYVKQGMSDGEAWQRVAADTSRDLGVSALSGAAFGGLMSAAGNIPRLKAAFTSSRTPEQPTDIPKVEKPTIKEIKKAVQKQTDEAKKVLKEAEPIEEWTKNQLKTDQTIPKVEEPKTPEMAGVNPDNVVYHSGILSRLNKADSAGKMESTRDTGYFGTGHYFVDNAHKGEISTGQYGEKPFSSVDISKYGNLYKANTNAKADKLHNFSQKMMRYINGHNDKYFVDNGEIDNDALKEYMDDMYKEYRDLFDSNAMSRDNFERRLNDFRTGYNFDSSDRGDSAFTTFMKEHGYNGVDTRGTRSANTERGIVIYDLDEDSVLQSNVTDAKAKQGLMNTRIRNNNPVFDTAEDARIQKEIDAFDNKMRTQQEYHRIYDTTKLDGLAATIDDLKNKADNLENRAIPYYRSLIEDEGALQREVNDEYRMYSALGMEQAPEEIRERLIANAKSSLNEIETDYENIKKTLAETQKAYDDEIKVSNKAYEQAIKNLEAPKPAISAGDSAPETPNAPNMKVSEAYENTLKNSGIMTDDEIAKRTVPENFSYESHSEVETMAEGARMRDTEGEDFVPNRLDKDGFTAADVDGMMQAWRDKVAEARAADEAGENSDALWEEANTIFRKIQQESSRGGAALQAMAKWSRNTPEGMLSEAENIVNKRIKVEGAKDGKSKQVKDAINKRMDKAAVEKQKPILTQAAEAYRSFADRLTQSADASEYKGSVNNIRKLNDAINKFEKALDDGNIGRIQETYTALKKRAASMSKKGPSIDVENKDVEDAIKNLVKHSRVGGFEFSADFQKTFINEASRIQDLDPDTREFKEAYARLGRMVNDEIRRNTSAPKLLGQRITAYLMNNMLGNFRTLITRNAGGNLGLALTEQFAERPLAAGIDRLVAKKTGIRTQAGLSKAALKDYVTGFVKGISEEVQDVKSGLHTSRSGEVDLSDAIARNSDVFKTDSKNKLLKGLSGLARFKNSTVAHGLSVGDRPFYEAIYKQTLGDMNRMKEKGLLGDAIQNLTDAEYKALSEGVAQYNALFAVYQNDSKMSDALMGFKKSIGELSEGALGFDILSQFSMPFVKTPANVVDRAIDYSPLGLIRNAARTGKETLGKNAPGLNQNRFVNETARNIIGTGLMAGAGAAAYNAALSGKYSKDKDEKAAQKEAGEQEYAANLPDNYQMDIGWIPVLGSNSVAAAAAVDAMRDPELSGLDKVLAGAKAGGKAMFDQSMFQGLQRLFGQGDTYNSEEGIVGNMINTVKQGATQAVPSLARQIAQVADPYERDLSNGNYDINSIKNTLPIVRETLQPKVDSEGNYILQNQGRNVVSKILEDMILPGKITKIQPREMNTEAQRLQSLTGNNYAYIPKVQRSEITTDDHTPTDKEYTDYQVDRNKSMSDAGKIMMNSNYYKSASPEQQEKLLQDLYSNIKSAKVAEYTGKESDDSLVKLYNDNGHKKDDPKLLVRRMVQGEQIRQLGYKATDNLYNYMDKGGKIEDYKKFIDEVSHVTESGSNSIYKDDYMEAISKLPEKQRKLISDVKGVNFSDEEQAAYDKGGIDAALKVWKQNKAEKDQKAKEKEQKKSEQAKKANMSVEQMENVQEQLANAGAIDSPTTVEYYNRAKQTIPSLTPKSYANYLHQIGGNDYKISQKEMISYGNSNNLSEDDMNRYWNAFGNWKRNPVLVNGTWKAK